MELEFYGAAGYVTGSCHILRVGGRTVLLDCGMIQGGDREEAKNADPFPFDPAEIDAVVLSHAHIDHSGRLPLLVKRGFEGHIHTQNASMALIGILLADCAGLEASRVRRKNRRQEERNLPLLEPLYTQDDVDDCLTLVRGHAYDEPAEVVPGVRVCFRDAGHIMGSGVVELELQEEGQTRTLVFSGDLGQYDSPILRDPVSPPRADRVIMESTYGDRQHRDRVASLDEMGQVFLDAWEEGGNVLIPAFAVGRSQEILYHLGKHFDDWGIERWHIFLDSPLGIEASEIYWDYDHLFDAEANRIFREDVVMPKLPNLHFTRSTEESQVINRLQGGAIVIAGSGMCNGGRILHHFRHNIERRETHILFTGYQPPGTLGRRIIDGAETVRIYKETYRIRAQTHTIGGMSAHGDQADLLRWYAGIEGQPPVHLVHGDPDAAEMLRSRLTDSGANASVAKSGQIIAL
ncbi:MAG: MBL fold metallo-hydrolase [Gammaproteobacteria bacterium]|jgi:metallo-beta-lactamase family protein|nr:MAG: MBL fold metallo-hydrolase [Gammaproteobacteria bacterium]